jgi:hypothetical protein
MNFYVNSLQPYIAQVEKEGRIWSELHLQIADRLPTTHRNWLDQLIESNGKVWGPYLLARARHTKAWQDILDQCGLRPGR